MKILLYTPVFFPMVGGMETVAESMAELLTKAGHECRIITPVKHDNDNYIFAVFRDPIFLKKIKLILWADIVYSNGATLAILPLAKILRKPFVWKHAGYQASCIDGLGWVEGKKSPMTPWRSFIFHVYETGILYAIKGIFKLCIRRFAAKYLVDMNVAITNWVAYRQPFKTQVQIYNPSPLYRFRTPSKEITVNFDFVYMGRLVSEKGLKTLIDAFKNVIQKYPERKINLLIIGDGNYRSVLEELVQTNQIENNVKFVGRKIGQELTDLIHSASIAIVPSDWEEPMGIVALELMAAGRNIIVSKNGGLKECVGDAGLLFTNENHIELANCMIEFLDNEKLRKDKREIGELQIKKFEPELLVEQYIGLFKKIVYKK
jgi:glycosyltransferase involved in cell wall biosynthesis